MDRVELHFHLLPGVDDGPPDLGAAVELARAAVRDGTRLVTCTPHAAFVDVAEVPERVRELRAALAQAGIDLEVRPGAELAWDDVPALDADELETVAQGPPGRRWLLLEAPLPGTGTLADLADSARSCASAATACSSVIRSARPRSCRARRDRGPARRRRPLQVNGSSLTGYHGAGAEPPPSTSSSAGRATVVASDAHRPTPRPEPDAAVEVLRRHGMPAPQAEGLVTAAPRALLEHGLAPRQRLAA